MVGDVILQAIAEVVLYAPMRTKTLRRVRWVVLGFVVALTVTR